MNLSYNVLPQSFQNMRPVALASEHAGLHSIAIADSPLISRELFLSCAECLHETKSLNVMTAVTNPLTRHPSVAASAIATLCEMAPGASWSVSPRVIVRLGELASVRLRSVY